MVSDDQDGVFCDNCCRWFHRVCLNISKSGYNRLKKDTSTQYTCFLCLEKSDNRRIKWGELEGLSDIDAALKLSYSEIVKWQSNVFQVPRGKVGKSFLTEVAKILQQFNSQAGWEPVALLMLHVFIPLMLQKPSQRSKNKDHIKHLSQRLELWKQGRLTDLMAQAKIIQTALLNSTNKAQRAAKRDQQLKSFSRLMLQGKVKQALKFVDEDSGIMGIHEITPEVMEILRSNTQMQSQLAQMLSFQNKTMLFCRYTMKVLMRSRSETVPRTHSEAVDQPRLMLKSGEICFAAEPMLKRV